MTKNKSSTPKIENPERPELARSVRELLIRHGTKEVPMTAKGAERKTGISQPMMSELIAGRVRTRHMVRRLADAFKVPRCPLMKDSGFDPPLGQDIEWDREHFGILPISRVNVTHDFADDIKERGLASRMFVPYEGDMRCGPLENQADEFEKVEIVGAVLLTVRGDSMLPYFKPGDHVLVKPVSEDIRIGQIYVIRIEGDRVCKELEGIDEVDGEEWLTFKSANGSYPRIRALASHVIFQGIPVVPIPKDLIRRAEEG